MFLARLKNIRKTGLVTCAFFVLGGCFPFSQQTHYRISGLDDTNPALQTYLSGILDNRLQNEIEEEDGSEEFARAAAYREYTVANDLEKAMRAKGYYDAKVEFIEDERDVPLSGTFHVDAGDAYQIASVRIEPPEFQERFDLGVITEGAVLDAENVIKTQEAIRLLTGRGKCYFTLFARHEVILNPDTKTADLIYILDVGEEAQFGAAVFEGATSVENAYLQKLVPWKPGDCYRPERVERMTNNLMESGLFSRADAQLPEAPDADGVVEVRYQLRERAHRSVKGGLSYYTDEGVGLTLGWEHRNFMGQAEKLSAELSANQMKQSLVFNFAKPYFMRNDQTLSLNTGLKRQDTDAFEELGIDVGAKLTRKFHRYLSGSVGMNASLSRIEDSYGRDTYGLVSFPSSLVYDNRDNSLNPQKGWLVNLGVKPVVDVLGESDPFAKIELGARTYMKPIPSSDTVLALRADTGTILGGDITSIPATERFFAGGGGSVRGFGYQEVGPYRDGEPSGGLSFVTGSIELRTKFTDTIGAVAFVDGGSVSEESTPDFDRFAVGAGLGFRYYTGFGPIRFDVAVPLNEKDNLDQNYQIYISIGQAF